MSEVIEITTEPSAPTVAPAAPVPPTRTRAERDRLADRLERLQRRRTKVAEELRLAEIAWSQYAGTVNPGTLAAQTMARLSDAKNESEAIDAEIPRLVRRMGELDEMLSARARCDEASVKQDRARIAYRERADYLARLQAARADELAVYERAMGTYRERIAAEVAAVASGAQAPSGRRPTEPVYPREAAAEIDAGIERAQIEADQAAAVLREANDARLLAELTAADFELREFLYAHAPTIIRAAALREAAGWSSLSAGLTVKIDAADDIFASMIETHRRLVADLALLP